MELLIFASIALASIVGVFKIFGVRLKTRSVSLPPGGKFLDGVSNSLFGIAYLLSFIGVMCLFPSLFSAGKSGFIWCSLPMLTGYVFLGIAMLVVTLRLAIFGDDAPFSNFPPPDWTSLGGIVKGLANGFYLLLVCLITVAAILLQ